MEDRLEDIAFGSVSASLYRTYTVRGTAMMGDMEDFFTYRGVIGLSILNIIKWQRPFQPIWQQILIWVTH